MLAFCRDIPSHEKNPDPEDKKSRIHHFGICPGFFRGLIIPIPISRIFGIFLSGFFWDFRDFSFGIFFLGFFFQVFLGIFGIFRSSSKQKTPIPYPGDWDSGLRIPKKSHPEANSGARFTRSGKNDEVLNFVRENLE